MNPKSTITNAIAAALTRIERARGFLEAATLSDEWVWAMGERALLLEAHHTTHIEDELATNSRRDLRQTRDTSCDRYRRRRIKTKDTQDSGHPQN